MTYAKGWIKSDKPARHSFAAHPAASAPSTPASISWVLHFPAVMDQGSGSHGTGSCTGHGTGATAYAALDIAGKSLGFVPSPTGLYCVGRCVTRGAPSPALTDEGAMPADVMRGMSTWGVRPMRNPTPDGRYSDADPSSINDEPNLADLVTDSSARLVGEHEITSTGKARILAMRQALAAGLPIAIGVQVDDAFEAYGPNSPPIGAPDPSNYLGGHYVSLYGYRTEADGSTVFLGQNSWGATTGWGKAGRFEATEAWVNDPNASDIYAMSVSKESI